MQIANQILEPAQAIKKPIGEIEGAMGMKLNNEAIDTLRKHCMMQIILSKQYYIF